MSTVTFQVDDEKAGRLAAAARDRGVAIEELLKQITDDFLARSTPQTIGPDDTRFNVALADSLKENEELLRRLAK
jgi:hypothetical protein